MATAANTITPEEYLRLERASEEKHEYIDGQMFALAGANRKHRKITANIQFALQAKEAESGCVSDNSDTRLLIPATKTYTYPDVVMTCGEEQRFQDDVTDTLLNPTLIVEVLSPSTEAYDRGKKFISYTSIPSFAEYLLVRRTRCWLNSAYALDHRNGSSDSFVSSMIPSPWPAVSCFHSVRSMPGSKTAGEMGDEVAASG